MYTFKITSITCVAFGFSVFLDGEFMIITGNHLMNYFANFPLGSIPEWVNSGQQIVVPNIGPDLPRNSFMPGNSFMHKSINGNDTNLFVNAISQGIEVGAINYDPQVLALIKLLKIYPCLVPFLVPILVHTIAGLHNILPGVLSFLSSSLINVAGRFNSIRSRLVESFSNRHIIRSRFNTI